MTSRDNIGEGCTTVRIAPAYSIKLYIAENAAPFWGSSLRSKTNICKRKERSGLLSRLKSRVSDHEFMKIGITFGCFVPLHKGHMDMIMRAKKENDLTFVFCCGYDHDRGEKLFPLMERYHLVKNYLEDDMLKVGIINDTELGLDESMSDHNWKVWIGEAYFQIFSSGLATSSDEFTWYVGEPEYKTAIEKNDRQSNCVLLDRNEHLVSGTLCRNNPLKYWDEIALPFRKYFSRNILIAGTASEGKTTLVKDIGKYFGCPYSYEKGRDICKEKGDTEFTAEDFIYNIYEQHKYNNELIASPANRGVFISDTDNMVTLMYADQYRRRENFALSDEGYDTIYQMAKIYAPKTKWGKIFLIKPREKDIIDDGERYMPDSDYAIRLKYYEKLKSLYEEFGYEYEELSGNYYENFETVKDYINSLYEKEK